MQSLPNCPKCNSEYTYEDGTLLVCPECAYEWSPSMETAEEENSSIKIGTKVKNIRLIYDAPDDHDIDCKIDGFGAMKLKSSVVKKA